MTDKEYRPCKPTDIGALLAAVNSLDAALELKAGAISIRPCIRNARDIIKRLIKQLEKEKAF